jgi:hypothetical protein
VGTWKGDPEEADRFIKRCARKVYSYPEDFQGTDMVGASARWQYQEEAASKRAG